MCDVMEACWVGVVVKDGKGKGEARNIVRKMTRVKFRHTHTHRRTYTHTHRRTRKRMRP